MKQGSENVSKIIEPRLDIDMRFFQGEFLLWATILHYDKLLELQNMCITRRPHSLSKQLKGFSRILARF